MSRTGFIEKYASEKTLLVWVSGVERLYTWTLDSGSVYKRAVPYFVTGLAQGENALGQVQSMGSLYAGSWYYNSETSVLYVWTTDSGNPQTTKEMIVTYRFFFGNKTTTASWNLEDTGSHVNYDGYIVSTPGYKHKIGVEQDLVSLIGGGDLVLDNTESSFDEIFDTIIFENKQVSVFSWGEGLLFSEAKLIFRGTINQKSYDGKRISFSVSDDLFSLEREISQEVYTDSDNVADSVKGSTKRWVYGRVDGLKLQSIDQIANGYNITGTVSGDVKNRLLRGVGTLFISELSPDDKLTIGTQEFKVSTIESDTQLTLDDIPEFSFTGLSCSVAPEVPVRTKNREFLVAGHATAKLTTTVVSIIQFNRVQLSSTAGIAAGDFLEFATSERIEVKNVAPGNIVVLRKNFIVAPAISSAVIRQPVQKIYVQSEAVPDNAYTINNTPTETTVTLDQSTEFDFTRATSLGIDLEYTNGSRRVEYGGTQNLSEILNPRDFIRPSDLLYTTFYEVLSVGLGYALTGTITVNENSTTITGVGTLFTTELGIGDTVVIGELSLTVDTIVNNTSFTVSALPDFSETSVIGRILSESFIELRTPFADPTHVGPSKGKLPNYISDSTIVSANVLGRTVDNTPTGTWIQTAAQAIRDLITLSGITEVNNQSFVDGQVDNNALVSLAVPLSPGRGLTKIKTVVDLLAKSTYSSITLDNDLKVKYKVLNVQINENPIVIKDEDVIDWRIRTVNRKNVRNVVVNYRHRDVGRYSFESSVKTETYFNDFVDKYIGTNKTNESDVYLYNTDDAKIMTHRIAYYNSLSRTDLVVTTDLRFEGIEIGEVVVVNFARMYKRFGDSASRKKAMIVIGKSVDGSRITLDMTDMGNIWNRSSIITPNTAPDFVSATEDEKLKYGYITDNSGIINDDDDTSNTHLIS